MTGAIGVRALGIHLMLSPVLAALLLPVAHAASGSPLVPAAAYDEAAARTAWRELAAVDAGSSLTDAEVAGVVDRLLATTHGRALVVGLASILGNREDRTAPPAVTIHFVDHLPRCADASNGCFEPDTPGAPSYRIFVHGERAPAARAPTVFLFGEYPGNGSCDVVTFFEEPASMMAQTLYHELLHVWYVNAHSGQPLRYPTGHGLVARCQFEDDFLAALRAQALELAVVEGRAPRRALRDQPPP